jgi:hypothetical protein
MTGSAIKCTLAEIPDASKTVLLRQLHKVEFDLVRLSRSSQLKEIGVKSFTL